MTIRDSVGGYDASGHRYRDEAGNPVVPGQKLGEGSEGAVYLVGGQPGSVVKIWHPDRIPPDADARIRHMVNNPVIPESGAAWRITWPQHSVIENGITVGYTMPFLDPGDSWDSIIAYYNRKAAWSVGAAQGRVIGADDWGSMARNLALGFKAVHEAGYIIGDINEKVVMVNQQNEVAIVECDSYGFADPGTGWGFSDYSLGRPDFQAPETHQSGYGNRTQNHDRFGLAVLIFLLLTGYHPYTIAGQHAQDYPLPGDRIGAGLFPAADQSLVAPQSYCDAWDTLTDQQVELFMRCFDWRYQGQLRPTPAEWAEAAGFRETVGASVHDQAEFAANPEARCSIVLLLDVSGSMSGQRLGAVNQALVKFHEIIRSDWGTALRADVAIVAFSGDAEVVMNFTNGVDFEPPVLTAGGGANFDAGIELALDITERRKQNYRDAGIAYYRSMIYFLTGGAGQIDSRTANRLAQMEADRSIAFFAFVISGDGSQLSASLPRPPIALTSMEQLDGSIQWLSRSVASVSQS